MTEMPLQTDQTEFGVSISGTEVDMIGRRVNAERLLKLMVEELIRSNQSECIRVLTDNRLVGEPGADFLFQVDDYDLRLELLDAPDNELILPANKLPQLLSLLENNPNTVALILVWTTDDLQAIPLSVTRIRFVAQNPTRLSNLLATAKPLAVVLHELISWQVKSWEINLDQKLASATKFIDTYHLFEEAIGEAIDAERQRSYRQIERKQAAQRFPAEEEKQLIFSILEEALNGVPAKELVPKLMHLSRRGRL